MQETTNIFHLCYWPKKPKWGNTFWATYELRGKKFFVSWTSHAFRWEILSKGQNIC